MAPPILDCHEPSSYNPTMRRTNYDKLDLYEEGLYRKPKPEMSAQPPSNSTSTFGFMVLVVICLTILALQLKSNPADLDPKRHPLDPIQRTHVPGDESVVRYVTFGNNNVHGSSLVNHRDAYPYLLSKDVHNAAIEAGGPALSAVCTESMTGEGVFDVVVLDFEAGAPQFRKSLLVLAKRLRQRFPNALMIAVQRWNPSHIVYTPEGMNDTQVGLLDWMEQHHIQSIDSPEFRARFSSAANLDWHFRHFNEKATLDLVEEVDAQLVRLLRPDSVAEALDPKNVKLFDGRNPSTLSEVGHQTLAALIQFQVDQRGILDQDSAARGQVGNWGQGDVCHLWGTTGKVGMDYSRAKMVRFAQASGGYKFGLEFQASGGSITMENPFSTPRILYLTYLTVQTSKPLVQVLLGDRTGAMLGTDDEDASKSTSIVPRTVAVGHIDPGATQVKFEAKMGSIDKFRLVGASLLGSTEVSYEHTLPY